jgi:hypothetical protein
MNLSVSGMLETQNGFTKAYWIHLAPLFPGRQAELIEMNILPFTKKAACGEPAIPLHSYTVSLVQ